MIKIEVNEGKTPWIIGIATILIGIGLAFVPAAYRDESPFVMISAYAAVFLIICSGIWMCMDAANRKLTVEERNICYSDWRGRKKTFSLDEIGYCKAVSENRGNNDYLKLYDLLGDKLCKLDFQMKNSTLFLQYLIDNQVKIEYSEKSDPYLKIIINTNFICPEEIPEKVEHIYETALTAISEWLKKNPKFGVEWKTGIAVYLEEEMEENRQLPEQKGYTGEPLLKQGKDQQVNLPEGYMIVLEGYLQKDGQFVMDRRNRAVCFYVPVVRVVKSMQIGETLSIRFFESAIEDLAEQLWVLENFLPVNRYHTGEISFRHELYTKPPFGITVSDTTWKSMDNDI